MRGILILGLGFVLGWMVCFLSGIFAGKAIDRATLGIRATED